MRHPFMNKFCCSVQCLAIAIAMIGCAKAVAQRPLQTLLVGADRRPALSLDGEWHYLVDPPPARGLYSHTGDIRENGYAQNTHPNISSGPHNEEYDFATAPTMKIPGDWNTQDQTLFRYEGVVWFQRDFEATTEKDKRLFLHFGAVNYRAFVWLNGKHICDHEGGFTPFDCEVTEALNKGANSVVVAVDSTRHIDDIPTLNYDWFNYGGITRSVSLVTVPTAFMDDYDIHLKKLATFSTAEANTVEGYVHLVNAKEGTKIEISIPEAKAKTTTQTNAEGLARFEMKAPGLELWAPGQPKLYEVNLSTGTDSIKDSIGFRDIRVEGTRILLNGKSIFLQGANMHAEAPIRGGRANTEEDVQRTFTMLTELGANFVRFAHYPHDERMLRNADRLGILVWSEIPLWQNISFYKQEVYKKAVAQLNEMVRRDRNKASIIFWSVSNETPNNPVRTKFLTDLAKEAKHLDPTRLITSALLQPHGNSDVIVQDDPLTDALDVVGQNEYIGWYIGRPEDADLKTWKFPNKPIIMSEFGAEAKYGNHGAIHDRWAEEQQSFVFQHQFIMLQKIPQLRGVAPWVLMDFRSPTRNIPKLQDGYNRKGLFSEKMEKKQSFSLFQKAYQNHSLGKPE